MSATIRLALAGLMLFGVSGLIGCSKSKSAPDSGKLVGSWVEVNEQASPRMKPPENTSMRKLTINADKTFKLEVCNPDGTPIAGQTASGNWKQDASGFSFEATTNTLDEAHKDQMIQSTTGPTMFPVNGTPQERMVVSGDKPATFKRQ